MSGLEVIGGISAVISILDASIKAYDSARNDIKLSETFDIVRRRLPVILDTLKTCKSHMESKKESIPKDVCEALEKTVDDCDTKATNLRGIFERIIPGPRDTWTKRYLKVLRRLGKGNKVEELMLRLTEDVQLIVNHDAIRSANQPQKVELEAIIDEMKSVTSSVPDEESSAMNSSSAGGPQTTNVNNGTGKQYNNSGNGKQYNAETQNFVISKQREDFSFRGPVGLCLRQAPYIASDLFVGRVSELNEIERYLQKEHRLVLGGMGGVGKSRLAIAYAELRSRYYSSVFWLNAASEAALKESFRSIAWQLFDIRDLRALKGEEVVGCVLQWLSDSKNTRWLLVFDDYDEPSQFKISDFFPPAPHGDILVTTRRPGLVTGITLDIEPLQNIEDGLAILKTRSKREGVESDPHAKRLAKRLAGLPLALATAGTYLLRSALTFECYLQEYEKRWNIDPSYPAKLEEYRECTLYTTWDLSYADLQINNPDAACLLKLMAYFGNQNLWWELFRAGLSDESPEWLHAVVADDMSFHRAMRTLTEYYFLEVHLASESWSMHNCVHDWALAALNKEIIAEYYWYAFGCIYMTTCGVSEGFFAHINFTRLAGHASWLVQKRFLENDLIFDSTPGRLDKVLRVLSLLQNQGQLAAAEQMCMQALAGFEKALGPENTSVLETVNALGVLYCVQGKLDDAEQMYMRALAGFEKALGPEDTSVLDTVNNLGGLYRDQGKLDNAEQMYMRALAGYKKAVGPEHTLTFYTMQNLGNVYSDQGRLAEAEHMYMQVLIGYQKGLVTDDPSILITINNLGSLYYDQGKLDRAECILMLVLAMKEKTLGPEHMSTLTSVRNLGKLYCGQGKLDKAEEMYIRALAGYEKALDPEHTSTIGIVDDLGNLYYDQGKLDEAEQMYMRALAGYEKALGPEHTSTLDTVNNLGLLYSDQGKLSKAAQMLWRAGARK
ncbi:hypothetical protein N7492_007101 [Penicillium capsulatum]|uniref:NACHT-NTPase and P-loop NTPases N-terminal domain-containing protein n=1 Tax=Penicillium capsulatum TaxID=69766 RepID=A0A9W9I0N2_9EURO|nr:hypothetical protein N7492_007101 [Penicillium capsulatum]KAJ6116938.1 hypothetical protein N7512_006663 [Penicillium capsulatum]